MTLQNDSFYPGMVNFTTNKCKYDPNNSLYIFIYSFCTIQQTNRLTNSVNLLTRLSFLDIYNVLGNKLGDLHKLIYYIQALVLLCDHKASHFEEKMMFRICQVFKNNCKSGSFPIFPKVILTRVFISTHCPAYLIR